MTEEAKIPAPATTEKTSDLDGPSGSKDVPSSAALVAVPPPVTLLDADIEAPPDNPSRSPDAGFTPLEEQIRQCFGRVVWTHKTHEKEADACNATLRRFKIAQIVVSTIATSGALAAILHDGILEKAATAIFSIGSLFMSAYMKGFDPGGTAQKHRGTAAQLWSIRESYLSMLTDLRSRTMSGADAMKRRDELQGELATIYKDAPQTGPAAYADASSALTKREEYTFSDSEIDAFLPSALRKP